MEVIKPEMRDNNVEFKDKAYSDGGEIVPSYLNLWIPKGKHDDFDKIPMGIQYYINRLVIYSRPIMQAVLEGEVQVLIAGKEYMAAFDGRSLDYDERLKRYICNIEYPFILHQCSNYGVRLFREQPCDWIFVLSGQKIRIY